MADRPTPRQPMPYSDPELATMDEIRFLLDGLDLVAASRVAAWVNRRWGASSRDLFTALALEPKQTGYTQPTIPEHYGTALPDPQS